MQDEDGGLDELLEAIGLWFTNGSNSDMYFSAAVDVCGMGGFPGYISVWDLG